ncbi:MAG: 16S rRNA (adenine(1518)-N(6)/adenine(1519)-N(6))-dimethyltransferase RsmA [Atopobiaceae bacterium]|jgi:16S rRNA (adenine1518-N6/adenine1519-N6)-dimethyltransferase|nr:16S rRNA (adenine(1518)-N(6)/adenine(1519)-N(6))-dimethyltransferase RsmA [Atopobiaceae bacterium]
MYSELANIHETRRVLEEYGLATKKRLGQNFLVSDDVIGRILDLAELDGSDVVLEVGPGIGTLTVAMLPRAGAVVALEADPSLERALAHAADAFPGRLSLVMGDALRATPASVARAVASLGLDGLAASPDKLVSNLPYQVAATVLMRFMQQMTSLDRAVVMVQAEVADRIAAVPGTKAYGAYTAKLALEGEVTGRFEVGPGCFCPPPHVSSAVVRIERRTPRDPETGEPLCRERVARVCRVIDAAFAQRRKTIRNSMSASGLDRAGLDAAFADAGIDPGCRAETLSPADFVRLASAIEGGSL